MAIRENDKTLTFTLGSEQEREMHMILSAVYDALIEKGGYDPVDQIVGYILSEDPTYITNYNHARSHITRIDRDELLQELLLNYLGVTN